MNLSDSNLNKIKMIISDFDGIFTDGTGIVDVHGLVSKKIHFHDVMAIAIALKAGLKVVIITGEKSGAVDYLSNKFPELKVYQNIKYKIKIVKELLEEYSLNQDEILYVGDDVNDADSLIFAGTKVTVPNASSIIKNIENIHITDNSGGQGVFREIVDALTKNYVEKALNAGDLCK